LKKIADILVVTLLLRETENFASSVIGFNQVVIRKSDHADAVSGLFEEGAVTLLTLS
jgi:hypothetical protein